MGLGDKADLVSETVGEVIALPTGEAALGIANDSEVVRGIGVAKSGLVSGLEYDE